MTEPNTLPAGLAQALDAMSALGALLICADERRMASLARPSASGLGVLIGRLQEEIALGIDTLCDQQPLS